MKYFITTIFSLLVFSSPLKKDTKIENHQPSVVLQLFTSQGCSSCPRADDFLNIIKKEYINKNVIVMSYHVDYWDYIGWKDPFSKREYSELQASYGRKLNTRSIYTPQLVVNGKAHYIGSDKSKIKASISKNLKAGSENELTISNTKKEGNKLSIKYIIKGSIDAKKLQLALVLDHKTTKVRRGENSNRTLSNSNIVIANTSQKLNAKEGVLTISIPKAYENENQLNVVGFIQNSQLHISAGSTIKL
jgi:hypothetical protein